MHDEDVAIDGDDSDGKQRQSHIDITHKRKNNAEAIAVNPSVMYESRCTEWEICGTEKKIGHRKADDKCGCSMLSHSRMLEKCDYS